MKQIKSQRGALDIIIAVVITALVVGGGFYLYNRSQNTSKSTANNATKTPPDPYSDWKTFTSKIDGFSIKYPTDWKFDITYKTDPGSNFTDETGTITAPGGLVLYYYNPVSGIGGACEDPCPIVTHTVSSTMLDLIPGKQIFMVELYITNPGQQTNYRVGLYDNTDCKYYCVTKASYQGFPPYLIIPGKGKFDVKSTEPNTIWIYAEYPRTHANAKLSSDAWFKLPEVQTAELILKSAHY